MSNYTIASSSENDTIRQTIKQLYDSKNYTKIIEAVEALDTSQLSQTDIRNCNYHVGISHYKLNNYESAIHKLRASTIKDAADNIMPDYQNQKSYKWIGKVLYKTGEKEESIIAFKTSLELLNQLNEKYYYNHIEIIIDIARALTRLERVKEADSYHKLAIKYQLDSIEIYDYKQHAKLLAQWASHKKRHHYNDQARELLTQALSILNKNNDQHSEEYFYCISKSASLNKAERKFDIALSEVITLYNHTKKDPITISHAYNCRRIGNIHLLNKEYDLARKYYDQALNYYNQLGTISSNHISTLNERGDLENHTDNYAEAIKYKLKALEITKILYGRYTTESVYNLSTTAWAYRQNGQFKTALKYYKLTTELLENNYDDNSQKLHDKLDDIAYTYHLLGDYKNADIYYQRYYNGLIAITERLMSSIEEKDYLKASSKIHDEVSELNLLAFHPGYDNRKWSKQTFNNLLMLKSGYLFEQLNSTNEKPTNNTTYTDIIGHLSKDQVAIEFFDFNHRSDDCNTICALILEHNNDIPITIPLFDYDNNNMYDYVQTGELIDNNKLKYLIAKKLQEQIKTESPEIFFALSEGLYELEVNISELPFDFESPKYHHLFSTRSITDIKKRTFYKNDNLYIIGNIDYDDQIDSLKMCYQSWSDLIYDEIEIEQINTYCSQSKHYHPKVFQSQMAQEKVIKEILHNTPPKIVHFATHGFFKESFDDTPLGQCGLVLQNVNLCVENKGNDGILSGLEIKDLNLKETELVVLSSCYSGKGDVKFLEGIFGLQRAFKLAGANNIIFSLDPVSDLYSLKFMNQFYKSLILDRNNIHSAFYNAKNKLTDLEKEKTSFILVES